MNAKEELLDVLNGKTERIVCAEIFVRDEDLNKVLKASLKKNHTSEELEKFFYDLNFVYDNGFGGQELFGLVWLNNDSWLERAEYDGSEWWETKQYPNIPNHLLQEVKTNGKNLQVNKEP